MYNIIKDKYSNLLILVIVKSREVLKLLRVSRTTLTKYVKEGTIRVFTLPNGQYDYNEEDVYKKFNKNMERKTFIYTRVSTPKQKKDLENQIDLLKQFCISNGWRIHGVYADIASGISFENRKDFFVLLTAVFKHEVERVVITYKDRMSRVGFDLFSFLFAQFNTKIVVISEVGNPKLDSEEIFEEIVSLLHCYSMKLYSRRKRKTIDDLITPTGSDE